MAITSLTETEANALFGILVANAGHKDDAKGYRRAEFVQQFTDPARYRGEYWFSGEFNEFKLIDFSMGNNRYCWKLIKQTVPMRKSPAALALEVTNEALLSAYADGTLTAQRWTSAS